MKSIFDKETREEVVNRINSLNEQSNAQWGKMTVSQMVRHCSLCEEYYYGNIKVKRSFLGRIFGKLALSGILKDETSGLGKNAPTSAHFKVSEAVLNLEAEKENWKRLIIRYGSFREGNFTHWFFGEMTKKQLGEFIYKHCDHHLRQFGV
ncbi:MAG: DUF1569 domain-containing protein [Candidatus Pedobacter colombiensis]|uniref:DUF1569 domain-containing protein n=1 Tax=Candidatus Pedobacter colombiensis TaxID=3121371 RepID=A0AAJ5WDM6_9SPHI|nr:DUF1569 domain-containing protein [Pedobacter sp.]WEK20727.1 MAG: DUF1569 domain-containing protein [Pedobacter sp.]